MAEAIAGAVVSKFGELGLNAAKELLRAIAKAPLPSKANQMHGTNGKLQRSNSLPLRIGDTSIAYWDNENIQIIISSPDHIPTQDEASNSAAAAPSHGETDTGVNETTPQDHDHDKSSLKRQLYEHALHGVWEQAKSIYDKFSDMVPIPLTVSGDTALHVAVSANNFEFVKQLLERMNEQELQILNKDRNTAFCMAAILGIGDCFQIMIQKNKYLPVIRGDNDMLPVHLAAFTGHHNIVQDLTSDKLLEKMAFEDIERLFFMTISGSMYDVALKLFDKYPLKLAIARDHDEERLTALHMLARQKPVEEGYSPIKKLWIQVHERGEDRDQLLDEKMGELLRKLWTHVRQLGDEQMLSLISDPSPVLFDAVKSGNTAVVEWILLMNQELLKIKDPKSGQNILHLAALYRQKDIFNFIRKMKTANLLISAVDNDRNNVLHLAGRYLDEASPKLRPNIEMERELRWFKEAEKKLPPQLRTTKNKKGKTPRDIFYSDHSKLSKEVTDAAKGIGDSGMIVAVLIVAVAFAAAVTVPGDDKSNNWFIVFILANAVALLSSSTSIICLLSIFTSPRSTESEYIISIHPMLNEGLQFVRISVIAMIVAFVAACYLIFEHKFKWVAYVVTGLCAYPIYFNPTDEATNSISFFRLLRAETKLHKSLTRQPT